MIFIAFSQAQPADSSDNTPCVGDSIMVLLSESELQGELKARRLATDGEKAVLLARLRVWVRAANVYQQLRQVSVLLYLIF